MKGWCEDGNECPYLHPCGVQRGRQPYDRNNDRSERGDRNERVDRYGGSSRPRESASTKKKRVRSPKRSRSASTGTEEESTEFKVTIRNKKARSTAPLQKKPSVTKEEAQPLVKRAEARQNLIQKPKRQTTNGTPIKVMKINVRSMQNHQAETKTTAKKSVPTQPPPASLNKKPPTTSIAARQAQQQQPQKGQAGFRPILTGAAAKVAPQVSPQVAHKVAHQVAPKATPQNNNTAVQQNITIQPVQPKKNYPTKPPETPAALRNVIPPPLRKEPVKPAFPTRPPAPVAAHVMPNVPAPAKPQPTLMPVTVPQPVRRIVAPSVTSQAPPVPAPPKPAPAQQQYTVTSARAQQVQHQPVVVRQHPVTASAQQTVRQRLPPVMGQLQPYGNVPPPKTPKPQPKTIRRAPLVVVKQEPAEPAAAAPTSSNGPTNGTRRTMPTLTPQTQTTSPKRRKPVATSGTPTNAQFNKRRRKKKTQPQEKLIKYSDDEESGSDSDGFNKFCRMSKNVLYESHLRDQNTIEMLKEEVNEMTTNSRYWKKMFERTLKDFRECKKALGKMEKERRQQDLESLKRPYPEEF